MNQCILMKGDLLIAWQHQRLHDLISDKMEINCITVIGTDRGGGVFVTYRVGNDNEYSPA